MRQRRPECRRGRCLCAVHAGRERAAHVLRRGDCGAGRAGHHRPRRFGRSTRLADLKGKRVAVSKGSGSNFLLLRALGQAGLTIKDIQVSYLEAPDGLAAFSSRHVDAWAIWDPFLASQAARRQGPRDRRRQPRRGPIQPLLHRGPRPSRKSTRRCCKPCSRNCARPAAGSKVTPQDAAEQLVPVWGNIPASDHRAREQPAQLRDRACRARPSRRAATYRRYVLRIRPDSKGVEGDRHQRLDAAQTVACVTLLEQSWIDLLHRRGEFDQPARFSPPEDTKKRNVLAMRIAVAEQELQQRPFPTCSPRTGHSQTKRCHSQDP